MSNHSGITVTKKKVCLLGDFSVGKTSLIRRYVEGHFDDKYLSTIGVKISRKNITTGQCSLDLLLWDIAGGEDFVAYQPSYLQGASAALVVGDLTRRATIRVTEKFTQEFKAANPRAVVVLLGNKLDLVEQHEMSDEDLEALSQNLNGPYLLTSAKTGENVEKAFNLLADMLIEAALNGK